MDTDALWVPQSDSIPFLIRKALPNDVPFITNSWLKSYRGSGEVQGIPNNQYFFFQHKLIEAIVPRSIVIVAAAKEDPHIILGWLCAEVADTALLLHYAYVKNDYRKMGIGSGMLRFVKEYEQPPAIITTHATRSMQHLMQGEPVWFHNRFLAFVDLPSDWSK